MQYETPIADIYSNLSQIATAVCDGEDNFSGAFEVVASRAITRYSSLLHASRYTRLAQISCNFAFSPDSSSELTHCRFLRRILSSLVARIFGSGEPAGSDDSGR